VAAIRPEVSIGQRTWRPATYIGGVRSKVGQYARYLQPEKRGNKTDRRTAAERAKTTIVTERNENRESRAKRHDRIISGSLRTRRFRSSGENLPDCANTQIARKTVFGDRKEKNDLLR